MNLPILRRDGRQVISERVLNLAKCGLALATHELMRPGMLLELSLAAPDRTRQVALQAQVRYVRSLDEDDAPYFVGLELLNLEPGVAREYEELMLGLLTHPVAGTQAPRLEMLRKTRWRGVGEGFPGKSVELVNISLEGALLRGAEVPKQGVKGKLTLSAEDTGQFAALTAETVWSQHDADEDTAEVRFLLKPEERVTITRVLRSMLLTPRVVPPAEKVGSGIRIGDFEAGDLIGYGGMCEVYRGRGTEGPLTGQPVALKRLRLEAAQLPGVVDRFLTEADLCRMLSHPGVVHVHTAVTFAKEHWMAMELVEGRSLAQVLTAFAALGLRPPADAVLSVGVEILSALDYCHQFKSPSGRKLEIVHGDVTPSNVLMTPAGAVKLTDFGAASTALPEGSEFEGVAAKLSYLAPELYLQGGLPTPRVDVYQMGIFLYEALTGVKPYRGDNPKAICDAAAKGPVPPSRLNPEVSAAAEQAILSALAANPQKRPASAGAFRALILAGGGIPLGEEGAARRAELIAVTFSLESGRAQP